MHPFTFTILYLLVDLSYSYPDDVVCYRKWYFNSPRPAPRSVCWLKFRGRDLLICYFSWNTFEVLGRKKITSHGKPSR
ncbi:unnamed protein product [Haemonchus placei]|uniref:Secreted protein n=1 Tax=Haemonchus placei TaxID=6290 RepID=A0A0N4WUD5_HAEPC|nr:unnamed protein product [Haemonchus placei]